MKEREREREREVERTDTVIGRFWKESQKVVGDMRGG